MAYELRFPQTYDPHEDKLRIPKKNIVLFLLTIVTTIIGVYPLPLAYDFFFYRFVEKASVSYQVFLEALTQSLLQGLMYSPAILLILLAHEMGHFLACRYYKVPATWPFFIPLPLPPFGTAGAVIRMKGFIPDKKALFDIGVAGPLMGLFFAIPAIAVGLKFSKVIVGPFPSGMMMMGEPYLFKFLSWLIVGPLPANHDIMLHPIAYAGWVGLFVTALNLLPIGQLDGGHVVYAMTGRMYKFVSTLGFICLLFFGMFLFYGWLFALLLVFLIARKHPPTLNDDVPLNRGRIVLGIVVLIIFLVSFVPIPVYVS